MVCGLETDDVSDLDMFSKFLEIALVPKYRQTEDTEGKSIFIHGLVNMMQCCYPDSIIGDNFMSDKPRGKQRLMNTRKENIRQNS